MDNQFPYLDAQNEMSRLAQVTSEEQNEEEFDAWAIGVAQTNLASMNAVTTGKTR